MEKFIPYEKLSKKKRRELDRMRRGTWGALDPVTRKPENPRAYNRQKARKRSFDPYAVSFAIYQAGHRTKFRFAIMTERDYNMKRY